MEHPQHAIGGQPVVFRLSALFVKELLTKFNGYAYWCNILAKFDNQPNPGTLELWPLNYQNLAELALSTV